MNKYLVFPLETRNWYAGKGYVVETIDDLRPIDMINARYGRIKTDEKCYDEPKDRNETLYDVIDTAYGYVLTKTTKHDAKKFIEMFVKMGFTLIREYEGNITRTWPKNQKPNMQPCADYEAPRNKVIARGKYRIVEQ